MVRRRRMVSALALAATLLTGLLGTAAPAAAQGNSTSPNAAAVGTPRDGSVVLNSAGGGSADAPAKFTIHGDGTFAARYNRALVTTGTESLPASGFMLYHNGTLYGSGTLWSRSEATSSANWASANVYEDNADTQARQVLSTGTMTVTIDYAVLPPSGLAINATFDPAPTEISTKLYFVSNINVDGQPFNNIETFYVESSRDRILSLDDESAGLRYLVGAVDGLSGNPPDSSAIASEPCIFGKLSDCPSQGPAAGAQYNGDQDTSDSAIGMEWTPSISPSPSMIFVAFAMPIPVAEEEEPTEELSAPAQQCLNTTDMAISPERIELAPGGSAVVNLTLRNTDTVAQGFHDAVLSLSDGLSVSAVSDGMVNLGQRAALQRVVLQPNETRTMQVTVSAAEQLVTAPLHVAELYCAGRVVSRIDGVFVPVAAAAAAADNATATAAAAVEAAAPAPAPLPAVLPNTAGQTAQLDPALLFWLLLITAPALLLHTRRRA